MNLHRAAHWLVVSALVAGLACAGAAPASAVTAAFSATKQMTRTVLAADGSVAATDTRSVTVTADVTSNLRGRQVITLRWEGAHPSGNIFGNVSDLAAWTATEYPVVVLQCRGDDSATDPAARIDPSTCWTTPGATERQLGSFASSGGAIYRHDLYAPEAEKAVSTPDEASWAGTCGDQTGPGTEIWPKRTIPFVAANGKQYWPCGGEGQGIAPEMGTSSALPANEKVESTRADGTGFTHFEVRTAAENASLGCSATVPCAVVVIPVMGITCDSADAWCNQQGLRAAGTQYSDQYSSAPAVQGRLWASASNWRNRITIPITIAPTDTTCRDTAGRPTLQLYGSALISEAAEQWAPAYCGRPDRYVLRINDQVESTAFRNLRSGYGQGVVSTYRDGTSASSNLAYAPIAITGFAVAFVIDVPNGGGQLEHLKLSPRLLAKLLTASYWGMNPSSAAVAGRTDLAKNPRSLQLDPEFRQLNPALDVHSLLWDSAVLSLSQLMGPSVPADVMTALTAYIAADSEAAAFVAGTPDPWGMTVNASYKGMSLPRADWPLSDSWTQPAATGCDKDQPIPWFNRVLAPVSDLHRIAQDLLTGTPEAIYLQAYVPNTNPANSLCRTYREPTLPQGSRAMIALVTLADAERYGLPVAALRTVGTGTGATFVEPSSASLAAAVGLTTAPAAGAPFVPDAAKLIASPSAYPGTMVLHAALPVSGLDAATASRAAAFIRTVTTEGQVAGTATGQLPAGYLPIISTGVTSPLLAAARAVATAVMAQSGGLSSPTPTPTPSPNDTATSTSSSTSSTVQLTDNATGVPGAAAPGTSGVPVASAPAATPVPGLPAPTPAVTAAGASAGKTQATTVSGPLRAAMPAGLAVAALAGAGIPFVRRSSGRHP